MEKATIVIGCDYGARLLKNSLISYLEGIGHPIRDGGAYDSSSDFIDVAHEVVTSLVNTTDRTFGVLICGSGIGVSIAANRHPRIRAALCHSPDEAILSRKKTDANILCLGGDTIDTSLAIETLGAFITTPFLEERKKLIDKLSKLFTGAS